MREASTFSPQASHCKNIATTCYKLDDTFVPSDIGDILSFWSTKTFSIETPLHFIPNEVVKALLALPDGLASLTPAWSPHHNVDPSHFLRALSLGWKIIKSLSPEKIFQLLIDSGCSVSCSGFKEDFHGQLAMGDFGHINTADGQAKIEGFGML